MKVIQIHVNVTVLFRYRCGKAFRRVCPVHGLKCFKSYDVETLLLVPCVGTFQNI